MYTIRCTVYAVHYTVYSVRRTLYGVQCTVYTVHYTVYNVRRTVYSVHVKGHQQRLLYKEEKKRKPQFIDRLILLKDETELKPRSFSGYVLNLT